jgi:hypothetical protein
MLTAYVLDAMGEPVMVSGPGETAEWIERNGQYVADVFVGGVRISTVFLGLEAPTEIAPLLFVTILEAPCGRRSACARYRSRQAALAGHRVIVRTTQRIIIEHHAPTLETIHERAKALSPYVLEREVMSVYLDEGRSRDEASIRATCAASGYSDVRELGDAGWVAIRPLMFTHAIVSGITEMSHADRWCYKTYQAAKAALDAWDGSDEPKGWHRHPTTGRRFDENGVMSVQH